jgi:hypothetical protein
MEIVEPIFALPHIPYGVVSTVARDKICERYQIAYKDDAEITKDVIFEGQIFRDQHFVEQRTYYIGGKGLERFVNDYRLFINRPDIKIDMEARKNAILNLIMHVGNDADESEAHFRWEPMPKTTNVKISGQWRSIRGFSFTVGAPWVGHVKKLAIELVDREGEFIQHIAKKL